MRDLWYPLMIGALAGVAWVGAFVTIHKAREAQRLRRLALCPPACSLLLGPFGTHFTRCVRPRGHVGAHAIDEHFVAAHLVAPPF